VRASRGSERGHGRHLDVDPPGEPRRSLSQRNTRPFRDKVRAPGGSERGHGRHLDVDSPGEPWRKPPHSADRHRSRREYARSRPLVQGLVKQGKSRSAPCTSHKIRKPVRPRNNKQKNDQGHSVNVCDFAPVASRGACRGRNRIRPAEVASTRRSDNIPFSPLQARRGTRAAPSHTRNPGPAKRSEPVDDSRPLPIPEPYDKHDPHPSRNKRHQDDWTWDAWFAWLKEAGRRSWHKTSMKRALKLPDNDPSNQGVNLAIFGQHWQ